MSIQWIDIIEVSEDETPEPRQSSLGIFSKCRPDSLRVVGNLPHGYHFRPSTARDRDSLVAWLEGLNY